MALHLLVGGRGVDGARVAVAGDSAGGNLAAALALHLRGHDPAPVHQVLIHPVTTLAVGESASYERFAEGFFLTRRDMAHFADTYAAGADRSDARLSPAACADLAGAPPATVLLAEADPLHDEGVACAGRLEETGIDVDLRVWPGQVHPFVAPGAATPTTPAPARPPGCVRRSTRRNHGSPAGGRSRCWTPSTMDA